MVGHVVFDGLVIVIGVAVAAAMTAAIVNANIAAQQTITTFPAGVAVFGHLQVDANGSFQNGPGHATRAVHPVGCQIGSFTASTQDHPVLTGNGRKVLTDCSPFNGRYRPNTPKITPGLLVEIDKADNTMIGIAFKTTGHPLKTIPMEIQRIFFRDKNRIIAPAHRLDSHRLGQPLKGLNDLRLVWYMRFGVPAIGGDGDKPELFEVRDF